MGLKDPRHEALAVLVGTGKVASAEEAWAQVLEAKTLGPRQRAELDEILALPDVRERIRQAQQAVLDEVAGSEAWALQTLRACIHESYTAGKYATAIAGIRLFGQHKALQLFPQRVDHHRVEDPLANMSREELIAEAVRLRLLEPAKAVEEIPAETVQ